MTSAKFVKVGKVKDAHGIKGELFIVLFAGEAAWLEQLKEIRLIDEASGDVQNFEIKSVRLHKNGLIAKTLSIKDRNQAESLAGRLLEIPEEFLVSAPGEAIYLREIEGFKVFAQGRGEVGPIVGFSSNTAQDLLVVRTPDGAEYEIPFVEAFVEDINYDKREIHLDLPVGLLGELEGDGATGDEPQ